MCGGWSAGRCRLFWGVGVSCEVGGHFLDEGFWRGGMEVEVGKAGLEVRWGRGSWEDSYFSKVTQRASLWS